MLENNRHLPWRKSTDPYRVWVSEIMLQQTQIATVIPFYERWMSRFPNLESVVTADVEEILSYWQGLGYYRRCRNLVDGLKQVHEHGIPHTVEEWLSIKGIGRYTAGAISSIAQNIPAPIVDGNVIRVYARLTNDDSEYPQLEKNAWKWAEALVPQDSPGNWNQALMELGQLVCLPKSPICHACPIKDHCHSFAQGVQHLRPSTKPRKEKKRLDWTILIHRKSDRIGMRKARSDEWWSDLFVLPYQPSDNSEFRMITPDLKIRFVVTHHEICGSVFEDPTQPSELTYFTKEELKSIPIPAPFRKILNRI
jgi:A/G-specific adenine glycosylase